MTTNEKYFILITFRKKWYEKIKNEEFKEQ
jgi:hypothetical protein